MPAPLLERQLLWIFLILLINMGCLAQAQQNPHQITTLDKNQAIELVTTFNRPYLDLSKLVAVDQDVARELAKWQGDDLNLQGLSSIDVDVANELINFNNDYLGLSGVEKIDTEVAQILASYNGKYLGLSGLITIDKEVASELAEFQGCILYLYGLKFKNQKSLKDVLPILKSNRAIFLPKQLRDFQLP